MNQSAAALKQLGLREKEIAVYLALLEGGRQSVKTIAYKTGIPRTTLYPFVENLVAKGLVTKAASGYALSDPEQFMSLVRREQEELQAKAKAASMLVDLITPYYKQGGVSLPRIQVFEGRKAVNDMLFEYIHKWRESYRRVNSYSLWGYQETSFAMYYRKWHEHSWSTRDEREIIRLFSDKAGVKQQAQEKVPYREIRLLPKGVQFSDTIWVRGEFTLLGMISSSEHNAIVIHDQRLTANLRSIFQFLWRATEKGL